MTRTVIDGLTVAHYPAPSLTLRTGEAGSLITRYPSGRVELVAAAGLVTLLAGVDLLAGVVAGGRVLTLGGRALTLGGLALALEP